MHGLSNLGNSDPQPAASHVKLSTIKGFFAQSEDSTDDTKFDFKKKLNFGLISRSYETDSNDSVGGGPRSQWQRFQNYVRHLNATSERNVQYKVLFLGRHGQGWHNVAETKYGTSAWDCYWSLLDGADGIIWSDANLTQLGVQQAEEVHELWEKLLSEEGSGIPTPESYYVSPYVRAIETAEVTFKSLRLPQDKPYKPVVKELLRETIGIHTCDRRRSKAEIQEAFPHLIFEDGFVETDPLWSAQFRESDSIRKARLTNFLDGIFASDSETFLSLTSHSGAIHSILEAIGHRPFQLETGGVIPVFVRAETIPGERERIDPGPSLTAPVCTVDPTASPTSIVVPARVSA